MVALSAPRLVSAFVNTFSPFHPFHCSAKCNSYGYDRVDAEEAERLEPTIPKKVLAMVKDFWKCRGKGCQRVYWFVRV
jgi:uncharacterized protein with PIN domain